MQNGRMKEWGRAANKVGTGPAQEVVLLLSPYNLRCLGHIKKYFRLFFHAEIYLCVPLMLANSSPISSKIEDNSGGEKSVYFVAWYINKESCFATIWIKKWNLNFGWPVSSDYFQAGF